MLKNLTLRKDVVFDKCPECGAIAALRRSHGRNSWEYILKRSKIGNIYRCRECGWRGFKSSFSIRNLSFKTILFYLGLMLVSAFIIRFVITKFVIR